MSLENKYPCTLVWVSVGYWSTDVGKIPIFKTSATFELTTKQKQNNEGTEEEAK